MPIDGAASAGRCCTAGIHYFLNPPMRSSGVRGFQLLVGVILLIFGAFIALRPLFAHGQPLTPSRWLDVVFALFFLVRGVMNVRSARRASVSRGGGGAT